MTYTGFKLETAKEIMSKKGSKCKCALTENDYE